MLREGPGDHEQRLLLAGVAEGDRKAFETLFRLYFRPLFVYVVKLIHDPARAEEVVDDVMLELWRQAGGFQGESKVSTWLFGIAHNKALNAVRTRRDETDLEAAESVANGKPHALEQAAARELREKFAAALRALPPDQREVVELALYHEFGYEEIARIVRCPLNTVKTRMFYARQKLHTLLSDLAADLGLEQGR
jgi:RNA polymerase sigma-70 factor (ECF subfamily)